MNTKLFSTLLMSSVLTMASAVSTASDDRYGNNDRRHDVAAANNPAYQEECGACHFAYQPGLLPARSWKKMMTNLDDHFGENAELGSKDQQVLTEYLVNNAGDRSDYKRSRKLMRSISRDDAPLRISEIPYFRKEHDEIPSRVLKKTSLSNCQDCHTNADKGSYEEREIDIPGYGRWDN